MVAIPNLRRLSVTNSSPPSSPCAPTVPPITSTIASSPLPKSPTRPTAPTPPSPVQPYPYFSGPEYPRRTNDSPTVPAPVISTAPYPTSPSTDRLLQPAPVNTQSSSLQGYNTGSGGVHSPPKTSRMSWVSSAAGAMRRASTDWGKGRDRSGSESGTSGGNAAARRGGEGTGTEPTDGNGAANGGALDDTNSPASSYRVPSGPNNVLSPGSSAFVLKNPVNAHHKSTNDSLPGDLSHRVEVIDGTSASRAASVRPFRAVLSHGNPAPAITTTTSPTTTDKAFGSRNPFRQAMPPAAEDPFREVTGVDAYHNSGIAGGPVAPFVTSAKHSTGSVNSSHVTRNRVIPDFDAVFAAEWEDPFTAPEDRDRAADPDFLAALRGVVVEESLDSRTGVKGTSLGTQQSKAPITNGHKSGAVSRKPRDTRWTWSDDDTENEGKYNSGRGGVRRNPARARDDGVEDTEPSGHDSRSLRSLSTISTSTQASRSRAFDMEGSPHSRDIDRSSSPQSLDTLNSLDRDSSHRSRKSGPGSGLQNHSPVDRSGTQLRVSKQLSYPHTHYPDGRPRQNGAARQGQRGERESHRRSHSTATTPRPRPLIDLIPSRPLEDTEGAPYSAPMPSGSGSWGNFSREDPPTRSKSIWRRGQKDQNRDMPRRTGEASRNGHGKSMSLSLNSSASGNHYARNDNTLSREASVNDHAAWGQNGIPARNVGAPVPNESVNQASVSRATSAKGHHNRRHTVDYAGQTSNSVSFGSFSDAPYEPPQEPFMNKWHKAMWGKNEPRVVKKGHNAIMRPFGDKFVIKE